MTTAMNPNQTLKDTEKDISIHDNPDYTAHRILHRAAYDTVSRITLRSHEHQSEFDLRKVRLPRVKPPPGDYDPRAHRKPKSPIKLWMAYFNFLRSLFGAGILGLPLAISQAGIILGPLMAISIALLIIHMHLTLLNCLNEISRQLEIPYISYRYGFRLALLHGPYICNLIGHHGQYFIVVFMILSQLAICTVFVIFTTDSLRDLMDWNSSRPAMLILLVLYLLLEYFMKTLKIVSYISMLGNFLNLIGLILVIVHIFQAPRGIVKYGTTDPLALSFVVGSCLFNLSAIAVTLSLDKALEDPTVLTKRFGVITIGIFVPACLSTLFGVLGYWSFGAMEENILRFLPFDDPSSLVAIGLYLISIAFAYPIQCYPATQLIVDIVQHRKVDYIPPEETLKSIEAFARPIVVFASFLLCYLFPYQAPVVAFMGNFCTSLTALVFPATMEICILYPDDYGKYNAYLIKDIIIILLGLAAWFCGLLLCSELIYIRLVNSSTVRNIIFL